MLTASDTIDLHFLRSLLDEGHRVALFIRHSERPAISPDDKEFGQTLGLTPRGIELARNAGRHFAGVRNAVFYASPMNRCRLPARHFAEGMGLAQPTVTDAEPLGVRGFYYEDPYAVQDSMRRQGYMAYMQDYLTHGTAPHSMPIGPATDQMAAWLQRHAAALLNVFVSHDIFIASFLTALNLRTYTAENWVGFLHGAALIQEPGEEWLCRACVPDLAEGRAPAPFVH